MKINKEGYITHYLISGPYETPYREKFTETNQLQNESKARARIAVHEEKCPCEKVTLNEMSELNLPWEYYYSHGDWFVDKSTFYTSLTRVELVATVDLIVEEDAMFPACLWSYGAIDLWINGKKATEITNPVYKPIACSEFLMNLKKGVNKIYIKFQNLGVRDTRNIFGIQILQEASKIFVSLPDKDAADMYSKVGEWLDGVVLKGHTLWFPSKAPKGSKIGYDTRSCDATLQKNRVQWVDVSHREKFLLAATQPYSILSVEINNKILTREFEVLDEIKPIYLNKLTAEDNFEEICQRISDVVKLDRGEGIGFSMMNILARIKVDRFRDDDIENIFETLKQIENRMDCADFMVCALIRYSRTCIIDDSIKIRMKDVLLNFRYWMDQDGADAMCFWSENHSLLFYLCAMQAGSMYPDEIFQRSHKTGKQMYEINRKKVIEWLDDIDKNGFEEFTSSIYMCITFIALLNAIDFSDSVISDMATKVADKLFFTIALHTFQGTVFAPQGRVYRDVLYPFSQGLQSLANLLNPECAYSYGEGWLGFYATSSYRLPTEYKELMSQSIDRCYTSGNAKICLLKNKDYLMTSVMSPREDNFQRWENTSFSESGDVNSVAYIKSLNERFHGTTCFEPGEYGYQQHLWTAALAPDTIVFTNHPGGSCDASTMRPGYWFGNGVLPAIRQFGQAIAIIYDIPPNHPIGFTHIFFPKVRFEESWEKDSWLIGKKKSGYIGIWSSGKKEKYNDKIADAEYRVYNRKSAYLCVCSDSMECRTMDDFFEFCQSYDPHFYEDEGILLNNKSDKLIYKKVKHHTQIIL